MPSASGRQSYPVVSWFVVGFVVLGLVFQSIERFIPQPPANNLVARGEDFLAAGVRQSIDWRPLRPQTFTEAARRNKPILLLISDVSSITARQADAEVFTDSDVLVRLDGDFLCVRADASQHPEWASRYLPFSRSSVGLDPSFQIWLLDPSGRLIGWVLRMEGEFRLTPTWFLTQVDSWMDQYKLALRGDARTPPPGQAQEVDLARIESAIASPFQAARYIEFLDEVSRGPHGGLPIQGMQEVRPYAWRLLLMSGEMDTFRRSVEATLASGLVDWLDGGFFARAATEDWRRVEYDKLAVQNAEAMWSLAQAWALTGDPLYRRVAEDTFLSLSTEFRGTRGFRSYRIGDERAFGRSARASFAPRELREALSRDELIWVRDKLGMRVETNPQMNPRLSDRDAPFRDRETFERVLGKLRAARRTVVPEYGGENQLDVEGTVVARMIDTARLLGDEEKLARAAALFRDLRPYRAGAADVLHSLRQANAGHRYLGDFLAYADASLSYGAAFGDVATLQSGFDVLERSMELYADGLSGRLRDGTLEGYPTLPGVGPPMLSPNITDDLSEARVAKAMRLLHGYGAASRLLGAEAVDFQGRADPSARAQAIANRYRGLAQHGLVRMSALVVSSLEVQRSMALSVSGESSVQRSAALLRKYPTALVFASPKAPPGFPDQSGIFRLERGNLQGPLAPSELVGLWPTMEAPGSNAP